MTRRFQVAPEELQRGSSRYSATPNSNLALVQGGGEIRIVEGTGGGKVAGGIQAKSKLATMNMLFRHSATIRQILREEFAAFAAIRADAEKRRRDDGSLHASSRKKLDQAVFTLGERSIARVRDLLQLGIQNAVLREARSLSKGMLDAGQPPLNPDQLRKIVEKSVTASMTKPFPGTDHTTLERLSALRVRIENVATETLEVRGSHNLKEAIKKARVRLHDTAVRTRVPGGSISKSLWRIERTEAQVASHAAAQEIMQTAGIEFARWVLSPLHPARLSRQNEICDRLAAGHGSNVPQVLRNLGVTHAVDLRGLYTVDSYPAVPHAHCMCSPEPVYLYGAKPIKVRLGGGLDTNGAASVLQNMTDRLDSKQPNEPLLQGVSELTVSNYGLEVATASLLSQVPKSQRSVVLDSLTGLKEELIPRIQASIAEIRDGRSTILQLVSSGDPLKADTQATVVVQKMLAYLQGIRKTATVANTLQSLDDEAMKFLES